MGSCSQESLVVFEGPGDEATYSIWKLREGSYCGERAVVMLRIIGPGLCLIAPPPRMRLRGMAKPFSGPCVAVDSVQKMSTIALSFRVFVA